MASEEIRFDAWGLDVVLTASQKGLGTPPGLSILVASRKAIKVCLSNVYLEFHTEVVVRSTKRGWPLYRHTTEAGTSKTIKFWILRQWLIRLF